MLVLKTLHEYINLQLDIFRYLQYKLGALVVGSHEKSAKCKIIYHKLTIEIAKYDYN